MDLRDRHYPGKCSSVSQACEFGKLDELRKLVEEGLPVDVMNNCGWRPIHVAAINNQPECLNFLLLHGESDINWLDYTRETALNLALKYSSTDCMELLIENGADYTIANDMEEAPLHTAVRMKLQDCCMLLLEHGADVNVVNYRGATPLTMAVEDNSIDIVELLLHYNANISTQVYDNNATPIFEAAVRGHDECLKLLLQYADDTGQREVVNITACDNASPLYLAAQNGFTECINLLFQYGADADILADEPKAVAFYAAVQFNHIAIAKDILSHTSLHVLQLCDSNAFEMTSLTPDSSLFEALIWKGVDVNRRSNYDVDRFMPQIFSLYHFTWMYDMCVTPLVSVILSENDEIEKHVELLLNNGAYPNSQSQYDFPPLLVALGLGRLKIAELLLRYGANINMYHPGITFNLSILVSIPFIDQLKFVLSHGAEVHTVLSPIYVKHCGTTNSSDLTQLMLDSEDKCLQRITFHDALEIARLRHALPRDLQVIDILKTVLDYLPSWGVNYKFLDTLEDKQHMLEIKKIMSNPSSLLHLCRLKIRSCLRVRDIQTEAGVMALNLPKLIKKYVLYKYVK